MLGQLLRTAVHLSYLYVRPLQIISRADMNANMIETFSRTSWLLAALLSAPLRRMNHVALDTRGRHVWEPNSPRRLLLGEHDSQENRFSRRYILGEPGSWEKSPRRNVLRKTS